MSIPLNIRITPEQEAIIKEELDAGRFRSVEELIGEALQGLQRRERSSTTSVPSGTQREAVGEMLAFVESNKTRLEGVSVKDLIRKAASSASVKIA